MEKIFTIPEVAELLKTNKTKVYELIKKQELKAVKIGSYKVRESDLENYIKSLN